MMSQEQHEQLQKLNTEYHELIQTVSSMNRSTTTTFAVHSPPLLHEYVAQGKSPEFKNKLLEWCQKNRCAAIYPDPVRSGPEHAPTWYASIIIKDLSDGTIRYEISDITAIGNATKVSSQQEAARLLLNQIEDAEKKQEQKQQVLFNHTIPNCIYMVDLENVPLHNCSVNFFSPHGIYAGFITKNHAATDIYKHKHWHVCDPHQLEQEVKNGQKKLLFTIEGTTHDLVDHLMSAYLLFFVNYIVNNNEINRIYIVTSDHAGECIVKCLKILLKNGKVKNGENIDVLQIKDTSSLMIVKTD